jgi:hypothetical protein
MNIQWACQELAPATAKLVGLEGLVDGAPFPSMQRCLKSPHVWVLLWLVFLGFAIWWHAKKATQPPLYDAFSYYKKAENLWANIHSRNWQNPLEVAPTFRPPGTVLLSYPLGFRKDFRGFYFRSSYFPILLLVLAIYVAGYFPGEQLRQQWNLAFFVVLLSTLPTLYHFEISSFDRASEYWGLIDGFLLGMASLATAAFVRSLKNCSLLWLATASVMAAFCLLIKPAGIVVMSCIALGGIVAVLARLRLVTEPEQRRKNARFLLQGGLLVALVYASVGLLCFHSNYLSGSGAAFGKNTMAIMRSELRLPLAQLPGMLNPHFGSFLPLSLIVLGIATILYWKRLDPVNLGWGPSVFGSLLFSSIFFVVAGIWLLLWSGGIDQIRYFSPFALMAIICMVPLFSAVMKNLGAGLRVVLCSLSVLAAANLALLLAAKDPGVKWQAASGVNLTTGHYQSEVREARSFLEHLRSLNRSAFVYSLCSGMATAIFEGELGFESDRNPSGPRIFEQWPIDWKRPSAVRIGELLDSQYVLVDVVPEPNRTNMLAQKTIPAMADELLLFNAWFTGSTENEGVRTIASNQDFRLLEITDGNKLEAGLSELVRKHEWPENFVKANPPRWWDRNRLAQAAKEFPPVLQDVSFGNLFEIHALSLEKTGNSITARAWIVPLRHNAGERWFLFFHQMDAKGTIISSSELLLPEQVPERPSEKSLMKILTFNIVDPRLINSLGIGIHDDTPTLRTLPADKGPRDWDNHRIVLPLPSDSKSESAG